MAHTHRWTAVACLTAAGVLSAGVVLAQRTTEQENQATRRREAQTTESAGARGHDNKVAAWLALGNQEEIALGNFAKEKATNERVKEFAGKMVQDHTAFLQKLRQHTGPITTTLTGATETEDTTRVRQTDPNRQEDPNRQQDPNRQDPNRQAESNRQTDATQQTEVTRQTRTTVRAGHGGEFDFIAAKQQITEQCLANTKKMLSEKSGAEFDKCYIGMMVMKHQLLLDTLKVLRNHASSELQQVIDEGLPTTQQHLEMAKNIARDLEKGGQSGQ